ncbi:MAG: glycoside hydrolase family 65 protein [Firmicutes bacterium]|nr:glycoside hydrolase family 65 protein [Bacillota bacterium]
MWTYRDNELTPEQLLLNESLFTLANGYLGVRGCFEEGYKDNYESIRGTYINGFYEIVDVPYGEKLYGFPEIQEKQLNIIDGQTMKIFLDGEEVSLFNNKHYEYDRKLYFDQGFSERSFKYKTEAGKIARITFRRIVSFQIKELLLINLKIEYDGEISVDSYIDGRVENYTNAFDPRVGQRHSKLLDFESSFIVDDKMLMSSQTQKSNLKVSCIATHKYYQEKGVTNISKVDENLIKYSIKVDNSLDITKYVVYTNTIHHNEPEKEGIQLIERAKTKDFNDYADEQREYLDKFWSKSDIEIYGNEIVQQRIRFSIFHFLQSVGKDGVTNISAKGLTGEGYEGHYFWDTEIYVLPALQLTQPGIARQLLKSRYRILDKARKRARVLGHKRGVKFPWRTITGIECSTYFPAGTAQYHINGDVAYSFIQDFLYRQDIDFMCKYGAEVIFETARLWLDIGHFHEDKFRIHTVTGPDEYTCLVNNNYYTNLLALYNMEWAVRIYEILKNRRLNELKNVMRKVGMNEKEIEDMKEAYSKMHLPYDKDLKINAQDDSFLMKKIWDFKNTPDDNYPLLLNYHPLTIYRHQVTKQPDTVLGHFLLEEYSTNDVIKNSYDYYEKITTHDSSLSACIHGIMASKCKYYQKAYNYFLDSLRLDFDNTHGNTKDGIHIANLAGIILSVTFGFGGYRIKKEGISFNPWKPLTWDGYKFNVIYRGRTIQVKIKEDVKFQLLQGDKIKIKVYDKDYLLKENLNIPLKKNMSQREII